jgi:hypothetical protein
MRAFAVHGRKCSLFNHPSVVPQYRQRLRGRTMCGCVSRRSAMSWVASTFKDITLMFYLYSPIHYILSINLTGNIYPPLSNIPCLISPLPRAEQKVMRDVEVVGVENKQRNGVIPREPIKQAVCNRRNDAAQGNDSPDPAQDAHVAVLVALVGLLVARRRPQKLDAKEPVLDGRQVCIRLHHHDVLNVEAITRLGPAAEHHNTVDEGGDGECEVVILEPFGAEEEQESAGDGGYEDTQGDGGVVQETWGRVSV